MNLNMAATKVITDKVLPGKHGDIVSVARTTWDDEVAVAVTIKYRGRATHYEVWEVCFTVDGAWDGTGVYGCVATTHGNAPCDFESFEFDLTIRHEVSV